MSDHAGKSRTATDLFPAGVCEPSVRGYFFFFDWVEKCDVIVLKGYGITVMPPTVC